MTIKIVKCERCGKKIARKEGSSELPNVFGLFLQTEGVIMDLVDLLISGTMKSAALLMKDPPKGIVSDVEKLSKIPDWAGLLTEKMKEVLGDELPGFLKSDDLKKFTETPVFMTDVCIQYLNAQCNLWAIQSIKRAVNKMDGWVIMTPDGKKLPYSLDNLAKVV